MYRSLDKYRFIYFIYDIAAVFRLRDKSNWLSGAVYFFLFACLLMLKCKAIKLQHTA